MTRTATAPGRQRRALSLDGGGATAHVRVLLAHEHRLLGESMADALRVAGMDMTALVWDGHDVVLQAERTAPDVVVLRPDLPRLHGRDVCRMLKARGTVQAVMVVDDHPDLDRLFEWVTSGVDGYVCLSAGLDAITDAVRRVLEGEMVLPSGLLRDLLQRLVTHRREVDHARSRLDQLTRREREVLELLALGSSQGAVARTLGISVNTVRTHVQNMLSTLEVHSRLEAVTLALSSGWLDTPQMAEVP